MTNKHSKERILSGMRPTGNLHIGHLLGVLENYRALQNANDCFFMVADIHALTTEYERPDAIQAASVEMVKDWLASGINPDVAVIFRQSDVPEHAQLHLLLSMITPLGWLERCPSYKEQLRELNGRELHTYGFLGYPLLQAADILVYKATAVPVGEDQLPHIELTRELARRFNSLYSPTRPVFPEPKSLVTQSPKVPGTDARKMSKSYDNAINIGAGPAELKKRVNSMFTDPVKIKIDDKGHPEGCVAFAFCKLLKPDGAASREALCRSGAIGCVACKKELLELLDGLLSPIREERKKIKDSDALAVLADGALKARQEASVVVEETKKAMGLFTASIS
ncbi:MAG: tryptophan--tRNA ligase [Endomicrobiia bacterium]|nr:tryptophan--tRNA ligase [Endomicrobiia bacterium]